MRVHLLAIPCRHERFRHRHTARRVLRSALRTRLRVGEYTLALAGGACLIAYGGACARASLTQHRESNAFDAALHARIQAKVQERLQEEKPPNHRDWSPARVAKYQASLDKPVHAIGRLEIPDVDLSVMVLEGDDDDTLDRAVGHVPGTGGEPRAEGQSRDRGPPRRLLPRPAPHRGGRRDLAHHARRLSRTTASRRSRSWIRSAGTCSRPPRIPR
jgi:hypothetical protein